jgi:hypothetical protein
MEMLFSSDFFKVQVIVAKSQNLVTKNNNNEKMGTEGGRGNI